MENIDSDCKQSGQHLDRQFICLLTSSLGHSSGSRGAVVPTCDESFTYLKSLVRTQVLSILIGCSNSFNKSKFLKPTQRKFIMEFSKSDQSLVSNLTFYKNTFQMFPFSCVIFSIFNIKSNFLSIKNSNKIRFMIEFVGSIKQSKVRIPLRFFCEYFFIFTRYIYKLPLIQLQATQRIPLTQIDILAKLTFCFKVGYKIWPKVLIIDPKVQGKSCHQ